MANLSRDAVAQFRAEASAAIGAYPPGYIEGFRPTLGKTLTVTVGGGVTSVEGQGVTTKETLLTRQMWKAPYTGGDAGLFYYVYLTREGTFKVDFTKPVFSERYFYWAHPAFGWRVILRLWMDSDEKIKYVSREFRDTPRTVTVAPNGYVGEADYYCDGETDEVWIQAACAYADQVLLLAGTFVVAQSFTVAGGTSVAGLGASTVLAVASGALITVTPSSPDTVISDLKITGITGGFSVAAGSEVGATFRGVTFVGTTRNISIFVDAGVAKVRVVDCEFDTCRLALNGPTMISATRFVSASAYFIGNASAAIDNCYFAEDKYTRYRYGSVPYPSVFLDGNDMSVVSNCQFSGPGLIQTNSAGTTGSVTVQNCTGSLFNQIHLYDCDFLSITGNRFDSHALVFGIPTAAYSINLSATNLAWSAGTFEYSTAYSYVVAPGITPGVGKHVAGGGTAYLDDNDTTSGANTFGALILHGLPHRVYIAMYVPTGETPGNVTAKIQGYDGSSWVDLDTASPVGTAAWEDVQLDWTSNTETYTGHRVIVTEAASDEFYIGAVAVYLMSPENVDCNHAYDLAGYKPFHAGGDYGQFITIANNSWQDARTRIAASTTLAVSEAGDVVVDPSAGAVTATLPSPAATKGLRYRIENRHYGYGLIDRGDCESTTAPMISGESANTISNATFARSSDQAHTGTYSYKVTKAVAAGTVGYVALPDSVATNDLHGLTADQTYTFSWWLYVPTTGGPSALTEASVYFEYYNGSAWVQSITDNTAYDEWQHHTATLTLSSGTGVRMILYTESAMANGEYYYIDDIQLYRHYDVTVSGPMEDRTSLTLSSEGDFTELVSDGDKYLMKEWRSHGQDTNGEWEIDKGWQTCWLYETVTDQSIHLAYGSLYQNTRSVTFPRAFSSTPVVTCSLGKWGTSASWGGLSGASSTGATLRFWDISSRSTGTTFKYSYIAIGWAS